MPESLRREERREKERRKRGKGSKERIWGI